MVTAVFRYAAFTASDQEALDFIHQAKDDWLFPDDGATVQVVASLDSRQMPLPKEDYVYHESMNLKEMTIKEAFDQSEKPKLIAPGEQDELEL